MDQLLSTLQLSPCKVPGCTSLTSHSNSAKDFCDSMGLTQSVNFRTRISPNGKSSLLDLVMTNFPANVSYSSSAPIGSSEHMLVRVNISLAILRELPQCQWVWHFTQADWQGLQAAICFQAWSPIATAPDVNSAWELFHIKCSSLCIDLSHLVFSSQPTPLVRSPNSANVCLI